MPYNTGVNQVLESMKEVLALYQNVTGNYRPLLDGERYLTDREVAEILKVSRRTIVEFLARFLRINLSCDDVRMFQNTRLTLSMGIPFESANVANEWHSSPFCLYFRLNCVNLPKSVVLYKLFSNFDFVELTLHSEMKRK